MTANKQTAVQLSTNKDVQKRTARKEKAPSAGTLEGSKTLTIAPRVVNNTTQAKPKQKSNKRKWHESSTTAQYAKIIELLSPCGVKINTLQFREHGIWASAVRTKELREKHNVPIWRVMTATVWDGAGYAHPRVAFYQMQCPNDKDKSA
jgi:hypothetical protein